MHHSSHPDSVTFRNGTLVRMKGYLHLRKPPSTQKLTLWVELFGECLCIYKDHFQTTILHAFDIHAAIILLRTLRHSTHLHLQTDQVSYCFEFPCIQQAISWATSIRHATKRSFHKFYILGTCIAKSESSKIHHVIPTNSSSHHLVVKITPRHPSDPTSFRIMHRECYLNTCLSHPNLVQAVDIFCTATNVYIVMEYMRAGTLRSFLNRNNSIPETYARQITLQITSALCHLHAKRIVHRDINPDKVLCSNHHFPMELAVGDFGNANFFSHLQIGERAFLVPAGSVAYMAPEMARGKRYGPAVDLWSLGAMLYEILCGFPPSLSSKQILKCSDAAWTSISTQARTLVLQLLNPNPEKRISALACAVHPWFYPVYKFPQSPKLEDIEFHRAEDEVYDKNQPDHCIIASQPNEVDIYVQPCLVKSTSWPSPKLRNKTLFDDNRNSVGLVPLVQSAANRGLLNVMRDNPRRFNMLMNSSVVQKQLSTQLRLRRRFFVIASMFVFVFRLRSLANDTCTTRYVKCEAMDEAKILNLVRRRKLGLRQTSRNKHMNN